MKFAIIVVAYNRPDETRRLVDSICRAEYDGDSVDLIVSIDKGKRQSEIENAVKSVTWCHGMYKILVHPERKGLRSHIFSCGSFTNIYDAVIVLEDDLVVSKSYYLFAKKASEYYNDDERVAQISLYSYAVNEFEARPFYPAHNDSDVYAMQVAQSWGECWTKRMWKRFQESTLYKLETFENNDNLHDRVNAWGKNSWKKVFSNYIVQSNTYVIYPYCSFTTNYSEAGEHCKHIVPDYHVVMMDSIKNSYRFLPLDECVTYDAFFERKFKNEILPYSDICIDIYGSKHKYDGFKYVATTKVLPYKIVATYGMILKPQENNVLCRESGNAIRVYDLGIHDKMAKCNEEELLRFDYGYLPWKRSIKHGINGMITAIKSRFSKGN